MLKRKKSKIDRFVFITALLVLISSCIADDEESVCRKDDKVIGEDYGIICKVIDHKIPDEGELQSTSFDCITTLNNSIVIYERGDVTIECSAKFPLEMDYDGVQPALNFDVEFYKRDVSFETNPPTDTFVISFRLQPAEHVIWTANYLFHKPGDRRQSFMISIFVEKKHVPWFLPLGDESVKGFMDPMKTNLILPCRVQNYDSQVQLYKDYEPLELNEDIVFDPRDGFTRTVLEDEDMFGEYECYIESGSETDRQKVLATDPEDFSPPPKSKAKRKGQLKFIPIDGGRSMAMCLTTKESDAERKNQDVAPFVNSAFNNPGTFNIKAACLHDLDDKTGRHCPGRELGTSVNISGLALGIANPITKLIPLEGIEAQHDNIYEIHPIHPAGGIQCGHNRKQYFTGTDGVIYMDYNLAAEKNAIVKIEPVEQYEEYIVNGWYGFNCSYVTYITVMPVWWVVKFSNGSSHQEFATNSSAKYFELNLDVVQVACKVSLWNSSDWFEAIREIRVTEPTTPRPPEHSTKINFQLNDKDQVLPCKANGSPKPTLSWLKNGEEDSTLSTTLETGDAGDTLLLNFPSVSKNDEGSYTCVVHSSNGNIEVKFYVSVGEAVAKAGQDNAAVPEPISEKCTSAPTLHRSGAGEEIKNVSSIEPGDTITVRVPNCPQGGPAINFTAAVGNVAKDKSEIPATFTTNEDIKPGKMCTSYSTLHSVENGEEIPPTSIKEGDNLYIRVLEQGCLGPETTDIVNLSVSVTDLEILHDDEDSWLYSKTVVSLLFVIICIALILLIACCAYYCMGKPQKIYYVSKG